MSEPLPEDWLEQRSKETRQLLNRQKVAVASSSGGDTSELLAIDKLEAKLHTRERIRQLRELTRRV